MVKNLVFHLVNYNDEVIDSFSYYRDTIIFDDDNIYFTIMKMPDYYELYINAMDYANHKHKAFKEEFIKPLLDEDGYIRRNNFGNEHTTIICGIEIRYRIIDEFDINLEQNIYGK